MQLFIWSLWSNDSKVMYKLVSFLACVAHIFWNNLLIGVFKELNVHGWWRPSEWRSVHGCIWNSMMTSLRLRQQRQNTPADESDGDMMNDSSFIMLPCRTSFQSDVIAVRLAASDELRTTGALGSASATTTPAMEQSCGFVDLHYTVPQKRSVFTFWEHFGKIQPIWRNFR